MRLISKPRKYDVIFVLTCLVMCMIIFRKFIFGDSLYIYSSMPQADTLASYFPYYKYLVQQINNGQFSFWSFEMGAGTSILSVYTFLLDPFNLIYIIIGSEFIQYAIVYVSILKIILAGLFFYKYINLVVKNRYVSFITGLLYAFSAYMIAWGQHYFFATFYVIVGLVLFCIERWISDNRKWLALTLSISIAAISNIYLLYMFSIYLCVYIIMRSIILYKLSEWKDIVKRFVKFSTLYLLGIGLSAFFLLPIIYMILNSPRISSTGLNIFTFSKPLVEYMSLLKIFSQNIFGVANMIPTQFDKWHIFYEMPVLYSGILPLLIIPQICTHLKNQKKYIIYLMGIILSVLSLLIPFFASMFNIFKAYNFRWSFIIICFNLLVFAELMTYMDYIRKSVMRTTINIYLSLLVPITTCLIILKFFNLLVIDQSVIKEITKVIIFIVTYYIVISVFYNWNKKWKLKKISIVIIIIFELTIFSNTTINSGDVLNKNYDISGQGYYDATNKIISYINELGDSEFFRVNKNYISQSENDSLIQNYKGLAGYNSVHTKSYVEFLNSMNIKSKVRADAVITGVDEKNQYLLSLLSVKYNIVRSVNSSYMYNYPGEMVGYVPKHYKLIGEFNGYNLYENSIWLPLGITFDKKLDYKTYNNLSALEKQKALLYGFVSSDKVLNEKFQTESEYPNDFKYVTCENLAFTGCTVTNGNQKNSYELLINSQNTKVSLQIANEGYTQSTLQFEVDSPVQFDVQSEAIIDKSVLQNQRTLICAGKYKYNIPINGSTNSINLSFSLPIDTRVVFSNISIVGETIEVSSQINKLKSSAITIKSFNNKKIEGNIDIDDERMALFSIPYDKGWKCIINGKQADVYNIDGGLTGVLLNKGYNDIVLHYIPPFMITGIIISFITILVLISISIVVWLKRKSVDF